MIPDLLTYSTAQSAEIAPAFVPPPKPAQTIKLKALDFRKVKWLDDPSAGTVTALTPYFNGLQIMGSQAKTPYNAAWQEADARQALLTQLGLTVPATPPPAAPSQGTATATPAPAAG